MARVLVTGGAGFIGSHLVDRLIAHNHSVRVFDNLSTGKTAHVNPKARLIVGDICNAPALRAAMIQADAVFHLAAVASVQKSNEDWIGTHQTNAMGTVVVMDAARVAKAGQPVPVIYASSAAVYGAGADHALRETDATVPLTAYGADKLSNEVQARTAGIVHGLPTCGLRFFNVYGPRQDPNSPYSGVISIFAERIAAGREIQVFGDGDQTRDFIHVSDIVAHLMAAWRQADRTAPVFNACTGTASALKDLIREIAVCADRRPRIRMSDPRPGDIPHSVGDPSAARAGLNVTANTSLQDGLRSIIPAPLQTPVQTRAA